jgi:drug/metabolite transporter (DMT)-like permease
MVLAGATLWGLSGTAAQVLLHQNHISANWLVSIRMLVSGVVLVCWSIVRLRGQLSALLRDKSAWTGIAVFAIVGLWGVQLTYFKAIAAGNAASATLLQYLGPPMIVAWLAMRDRRSPGAPSLTALALSLAGTMLLVTGGQVGKLAVPLNAVLWGLLSALCLVFYTLQPLPLIRRYGAVTIVGWGMLLGGMAASAFTPFWHVPAALQSHPSTLLLTAFIVLFGTLAAFTLYLSSLRHLTPSETGLMATAEPISAVGASLIFLHVHLAPLQMIGAAAIVAAIIRLSWQKRRS